MKLYRSLLVFASLFTLAGCNPKTETEDEGEKIQKFSILEGEYMPDTYKVKNTVFKFEGSGDNATITIQVYDDLASYINGGTPTSRTLTYDYENLIIETAHGHTAIVAKDGENKYTFYYNKYKEGQLNIDAKEGLRSSSGVLVSKENIDFSATYNIPSAKYESIDSLYLYDSTTNKQLDSQYVIDVNVNTGHRIAVYYHKNGVGASSSSLTSLVELNSFCAKGIYNDFEPVIVKDYNAESQSFKLVIEREACNIYSKNDVVVSYYSPLN